ncbi:hypothetical protein THAOC_02760 [Thalassiosira oceanica]|uniref:Uncharacterized protein n=1 Tax=Thalassiosira oceanica TaxID=159749 RepID=K0TEF1_THAOC|nr:hypothetical protein THAOC_02760 [Thalassiosira oceanica]|eukprot:EJK75514.1 hypothetical protein THAOC_02760 [Thalassiosira oceanica]
MIPSAMSRRSCQAAGGLRPAAVGKPSFAYFSVDYLLDDVCRPDEPTDFPDIFLLDATSHERSEEHGPNRRNLRNRAVCLASTEIEFFDIVLAGNQFWPLKWAFCVCSSPARKESPDSTRGPEFSGCMSVSARTMRVCLPVTRPLQSMSVTGW